MVNEDPLGSPKSGRRSRRAVGRLEQTAAFKVKPKGPQTPLDIQVKEIRDLESLKALAPILQMEGEAVHERLARMNGIEARIAAREKEAGEAGALVKSQNDRVGGQLGAVIEKNDKLPPEKRLRFEQIISSLPLWRQRVLNEGQLEHGYSDLKILVQDFASLRGNLKIFSDQEETLKKAEADLASAKNALMLLTKKAVQLDAYHPDQLKAAKDTVAKAEVTYREILRAFPKDLAEKKAVTQNQLWRPFNPDTLLILKNREDRGINDEMAAMYFDHFCENEEELGSLIETFDWLVGMRPFIFELICNGKAELAERMAYYEAERGARRKSEEEIRAAKEKENGAKVSEAEIREKNAAEISNAAAGIYQQYLREFCDYAARFMTEVEKDLGSSLNANVSAESRFLRLAIDARKMAVIREVLDDVDAPSFYRLLAEYANGENLLNIIDSYFVGREDRSIQEFLSALVTAKKGPMVREVAAKNKLPN